MRIYAERDSIRVRTIQNIFPRRSVPCGEDDCIGIDRAPVGEYERASVVSKTDGARRSNELNLPGLDKVEETLGRRDAFVIDPEPPEQAVRVSQRRTFGHPKCKELTFILVSRNIGWGTF